MLDPFVLSAALVLGLALTGVVGVAALVGSVDRGEHRRLVDRAARLGLELRADGSLHGRWQGHPAWVFEELDWTEVVVALPVPSGRSVRAGAGRYAPDRGRTYTALPHLVFAGDEAAEHALLAHEGFVAAATACHQLELADDLVRIQVSGHLAQAEPALARAARVAEAAGEALSAPWRALAEANGLALVDPSRLEGRIGARPVWIESTGIETLVAVGVHPPLTGEIRAGAGERLGDPILDGHVAVRGDAVDRLGPIDDALRASLLELFHQHPRSVATGSWVSARVDGRVTRLGELLETAWVLAERLSD